MLRPASKMLLVFLVASQAFATPIKEDPAVPDAAPVAAVAAAAAAADKAPAEAPVEAVQTKVKDAPPPPPEADKTAAAAPAESAADEPRDGRVLNNVETIGEREQALLSKLNTKCSQREVSSCVMLKMVTYVNKLLKKANIQVTEGLEISQTEAVVEEDLPAAEAEGARGLDEEEEETEEVQVGQLIANKVWAFVKSRSLRWNIFPEADVVLSASPDNEGALNLGLSMRAGKAVEMARKKNNNNMGPLLAAGVMKLGLIGGVAFKALALLVGKALILSKIAFLLGAILWLKKLFSQQRHVTYEVVAHPHSHSHSHVTSDAHGHGHDSYVGSSGWGRQLGAAPGSAAAAAPAAHDLAYRAHAPTANAAAASAST
ncbi:hypothetical protein R5R35_001850 [Gryllus longicercus]|uniref:Osiris n=1 Tax=Gryllus longicercus TaxID=2509291 RepID=A0AAN9VI69_9ORTH